MRTPPEGIEVGDSLTQDEIEDAYNTGFGYRISGINPRRDDHDRRYILLFANEDGPYGDSVTQGRFEYIGEGLSGDQSEDSPGNSALIDAQTSDPPIHFFYKRAEEADWEYQGLVDVVGYEFREQDGREVLVFTLEHSQHSKEKITTGNSTSQLKERPDSGETFTAEIDRISSSGNGIIETEQEGHINIGPVIQEAVGTEVTAKMEGGTFAQCMTKDVRADNYEAQYGTTQIGGSTFCGQCGSLMYPSGDGSRVCSSCGHEDYTDETETETDSDTTDESSERPSDGVAIKENASANIRL